MADEKKTKKKFKFLEEFKEFAIKGNAMSLAIGVIIGGAFQSIVTSLTENFIKPLIAVFTGGVKVDDAGNPQYIGGSFSINGVEFNYGAFLSAVINFLIMALILFLLVKLMNKVMSLGHKKKEEAPAAPPPPDPQIVLLTEIRDSLREQKEEQKV
ncbi:MAG: large conductance mechanosensitive channel protein MscL [Firmicutes bacterium]|nr:large conductance mechanosensitive channel protein MscL [[Eubacterium] siraeum]MCM1487675.1 large conductance mechanosensitive channel protein MscL [Bacillota bacterium]